MEGSTGKEIKQYYFEGIQELSKRFSVPWLCSLYGVSKSGYYRWLKSEKKPNRYQQLHQEVDELVQKEHALHPSYGYRSINAVIRRETGWILSNHAILKSMQRLHICSKARRKKTYRVGQEHTIFPNVLNRQFHTTEPFKHIATDICQFRNKGTRYFLTVYLDMFNNEIISWNLRTKDDVPLILEPLRKVLPLKCQGRPMLIHSDQGSQYASYSYVMLLRDNGIVQSMSRAGTPRDNAVMESCFGWFKDMLFYDFNISTCSNVPDALHSAVHHYNTLRPAYALNYKTPAQFKAEQGF